MSLERELLQRCLDDYLSMGGLFNPELVNHDIVRDLILDARAELLTQKREPLSDEAIADLWWNNYVGTADSVRNFARGIEKAHGIGGEDE